MGRGRWYSSPPGCSGALVNADATNAASSAGVRANPPRHPGGWDNRSTPGPTSSTRTVTARRATDGPASSPRPARVERGRVLNGAHLPDDNNRVDYQSTLDAIDAALDGCVQCGQPRGGSPSDDFCSEQCQERWAAGTTTDPGATARWDREETAHQYRELFTGVQWVREPSGVLVAFNQDDQGRQVAEAFLAGIQQGQAIVAAVSGIVAAFGQLGQVAQEVAESLPWIIDDPIPVVESPPQRALRLQQSRNTGPRWERYPHRGPRRIGTGVGSRSSSGHRVGGDHHRRQ